MACLIMDGFEIDFPDNSVGLWGSLPYQDPNFNNLYYVSSPVRSGLGALRFKTLSNASALGLRRTLPSPVTEFYTGFGFLRTGSFVGYGGTTNAPIFSTVSSDGSAWQVHISLSPTTNTLIAYRGTKNQTLLGTGSAVIAADAYYYIEVYAKIADTGGAITVRVNGAVDIELTDIDTNNATSAYKDVGVVVIGIGQGRTSTDYTALAEFVFDDFVLNDTTGGVNDSWPNGAGVYAQFPTRDGTHSEWTSTGGAVDYTEVDDMATYGGVPDGDTTRLSSLTAGQRTSVGLTPVSAQGPVAAIMVVSSVQLAAAGADQMAQFIRTNDTDYDLPAFIPPVGYAWRQEVLNLNPITALPFTTQQLAALEMGWKRVS